ncbi:Arc family DNA-binding protein [Psychrobacter sp. I-STPA6b]|uniref:Arc family DNA-binding protein n=1 Tax=Psychrobacter sp. I-STPA6b TaxID=2585718 RepID=UPI001D0C4C6E|nr:Arc family DNA-binding protein [Psychrobacter sp. I-STPA6b]
MSDRHKTVQFQLRLSPELREKIRESSESYNRSMNSDIIARLEKSFHADENPELQVITTPPSFSYIQEQLNELSKSILLLKYYSEEEDND